MCVGVRMLICGCQLFWEVIWGFLTRLQHKSMGFFLSFHHTSKILSVHYQSSWLQLTMWFPLRGYSESYRVSATCHTFLFWDEFCSQQTEQWIIEKRKSFHLNEHHKTAHTILKKSILKLFNFVMIKMFHKKSMSLSFICVNVYSEVTKLNISSEATKLL